jgi:hypothetical protein
MTIKKIQLIPPGYTDILHPETDSDSVKMTSGNTLHVDMDAHTGDTVVHITGAERTAWNGKADLSTTYTKTETDTRIQNVIGSAPVALDTLVELATALGNDANFASTVTTNLALKAPLASPTFTGTVVLPSTTSIGTVTSAKLAFVDATSSIQTQINTKAPTTAVTTTVNGLMAFGDKVKLDGIATGAQVNTVTSVATRTGAVVLTKSDVGLANVDNTTDIGKPVSTAQATAIGLKLDSSIYTVSDIKSKLGITTLSGSNTGDQIIPTTLPASSASSAVIIAGLGFTPIAITQGVVQPTSGYWFKEV